MVNRSTRHSATSFLVSLCTHLFLLLLVSSVWFAGNRQVGIRFQSGHLEDSRLDDDITVNIELPVDESVLLTGVEQLDEFVLEDSQLAVFNEFDVTPTVLDPLDSFSAIQRVEIDSDLKNSKGTRRGAGSRAGSGSSFFGLPTHGDRIVYLIDMSPSMGVGKYQTRYARAVNEVLESTRQLRADQTFFVILFSFQTVEIYIDGKEPFCFATDENNERLANKLKSVRLQPGTDPRQALVRALEENPTCIFLLSDGEFNGEINRNGRFGRRDALDVIKMFNRHHCPINTIGLEDRSNQKILTRIAEISGGEYAFIPADN